MLKRTATDANKGKKNRPTTLAFGPKESHQLSLVPNDIA
jgi:hypothetical protein